MSRRTLFAMLMMVFAASQGFAAEKAKPFVVVVMDPLSKMLACDCVKGYAQRDYEKLAKHLEVKLARPVVLEFGESLTATLAKKTEGKVDLIIGKESVVRHEASTLKLGVTPVASLTGKDGTTTMTGLIVVMAKDPILSAADLKEHKILFGLADADEKYSAPMSYLKDLGVTLPKSPETCTACSVGVTKLVELSKQGIKAAAVISSYAQPLLEGCGTIQKGDLKVVGQTDPVPFIVAFLNDKLSATEKEAVASTLMGVGASQDLCTALETKSGFVKFEKKTK